MKKRLLRNILLLLFLVLLPLGSVYSQFVKKEYLETTELKSLKPTDRLLQLSRPDSITAISFRAVKPNSFNDAFIINENDTVYLKDDLHEAGTSDSIFCTPVVFDEPVRVLYFNPGSIRGNVTAFLINSGPTPEIKHSFNIKSRQEVPCDMPSMIDQDEWREGLPAPSFSRTVHTVHNLIVHHSATGNNLTNYTNVVRNIYLYHTQIRGWSDIGYNYVIAQNGTIYEGRDPGSYEQDNVMGAHFCSRNTNTMGICVLGDYTNYTPTDTSMQSLELLLAWKADKDSLDPLGSHYHPLDSELGIIAGHRDGCATICPGDGIYNQLPKTRDNVATMVELCNRPEIFEFSINTLVLEQKIYIEAPEPVKRMEIFDMSGKKLVSVDIEERLWFSVNLQGLCSGFLIVRIITTGKDHISKVVYIKKRK